MLAQINEDLVAVTGSSLRGMPSQKSRCWFQMVMCQLPETRAQKGEWEWEAGRPRLGSLASNSQSGGEGSHNSVAEGFLRPELSAISVDSGAA